ncbi:unnamed protein product [Ascophyllum nodosum]
MFFVFITVDLPSLFNGIELWLFGVERFLSRLLATYNIISRSDEKMFVMISLDVLKTFSSRSSQFLGKRRDGLRSRCRPNRDRCVGGGEMPPQKREGGGKMTVCNGIRYLFQWRSNTAADTTTVHRR